MNRISRFVPAIAVLISILAALPGCASRSKARAQAAYLAGQNAELRQQQQELQSQQFPTVTIIGPVQNPKVPWVVGLTLAQAIATANYLDSHEPKQIVITRQGESATVDPSALNSATSIPLEPGDVVELQP